MNVADQLNQAFVLSRSWTLSTTLFPVRIAGGPLPSFNKQQYAVSSDGQRFLINLAADERYNLAHHAHLQLQLETQAMTFTAGAKLGPYEILSPIGAGGQGEVYKPRETRLGLLNAG